MSIEVAKLAKLKSEVLSMFLGKVGFPVDVLMIKQNGFKFDIFGLGLESVLQVGVHILLDVDGLTEGLTHPNGRVHLVAVELEVLGDELAEGRAEASGLDGR